MLQKVENVVDDNADPLGLPPELSRTSLTVKLELFIEWTYVFDLDLLSFTVNEDLHFRLDNMPPVDEWRSYIAVDGSGRRGRLPCALDA